MILSKEDLKRYINEDAAINRFKSIFYYNPLKTYLKTLRKAEYYTNTKKTLRVFFVEEN